MSTIGRCSSCHCYSRNCPQGQPNHKTVAAIGQSCTMNSLGRHYRDPSDPDNPTCNYEANGTRCTFFTSGHEYASLPYPADITYGPVSDSSNPELASILALLQQQKADQQQQAQDMKALQEQVASLIRRDSTVSATQATVPTTTVVTTLTSASTVPTSSLTPAPRMTVQTAAPQTPYTTPGPAPNPIPASVPQSISAAASNLAASLQACLGSGSSYGGLTMDHLRSNPMIANQAAAVLSDAIQNVAPLQANTALRSQVNSVDQLFKATTVNKQLRAYEFASTGQFS